MVYQGRYGLARLTNVPTRAIAFLGFSVFLIRLLFI